MRLTWRRVGGGGGPLTAETRLSESLYGRVLSDSVLPSNITAPTFKLAHFSEEDVRLLLLLLLLWLISLSLGFKASSGLDQRTGEDTGWWR